VTPVPQLAKALKDERPVTNTETGQQMVSDGEPVTAAQIARVKADAAVLAMTQMESEIDDQLTECGFNGECRKVARDAVRIGTGILKGPNIVKQLRKAWVPVDEGSKVFRMQSVEDPTPVSKRVDYWNIYPDPQCGDDIKRASYVWEYDEILPRELRACMGVRGYFTDVISQILREDPIRTTVRYNQNRKKTEISHQSIARGLTYEKWEYYGDLTRDDLIAAGVNLDDYPDNQTLGACVVFVNDHPIKVMLNVLDTGDLPYDFFQWCQVKNSPWGIGVVRIGTWAQRVIQAAWRAMMDNARDSSGANICIGSGVEPVDGTWQLTGKKLWRMTGDLDDVRKAFLQFQLESRQGDLQAIIEMALRFLDMETSLPMLFQGEQQEMPETLGATNIVVDSNNVTLRSRVKLWDDQITRPHVTRYYHWNMQYNENPDIKGDYNVDPRGTSVLLARDQQARTLISLMPLRNDPRVDNEIDWGKAVRELFTSLRLNVLKSDDDKKRDEAAKKKQPEQPQDPKIQAATIRSQGELQKAELTQKSDQAELEFKAQEAEKERQHDRAMKEMELNIKAMELSQSQGVELSKIKSELARDAAKINLQRELTDKKMRGPEMLTPPVEPPQRAAPGRAYPE
jgi:hypothetical protein